MAVFAPDFTLKRPHLRTAVIAANSINNTSKYFNLYILTSVYNYKNSCLYNPYLYNINESTFLSLALENRRLVNGLIPNSLPITSY